jgi:hypothetical protein
MEAIKGFEERFFITREGVIFLKDKTTVAKVSLDSSGYFRHSKTTKHVHRLVAEAFIPNPDSLPVVDHINGNRQDNRIENLRWVTHSQNSQNHKIYSHNKTGIDNTYFDKKRNRWICVRVIEGNRKQIGSFLTKEEAEEAVRKYKETGEVTHRDVRYTNKSSGHANIHSSGKNWKVDIRVNGQRHYKSGFKSIEEAIAYRDSL